MAFSIQSCLTLVILTLVILATQNITEIAIACHGGKVGVCKTGSSPHYSETRQAITNCQSGFSAAVAAYFRRL